MIAILKAELRKRKWSTLWWVVSIVAFLTLVLAVYPAFRDSANQLDKSLQAIPESARNLFTDTADFLSPVGYLSSQAYYLLVPLLFSFLSIGLGSSLLAREEKDLTIELLLARPISRTRLLLGKALAGLTILLIVGLITALAGMILAGIIGFKGVSPISVFNVTMMALDFSLLFGALAFVLTAVGKFGRGAAIGAATFLAFGSYIASSLDKTVKWLEPVAKVLPFHYYHPAEILRGGSFWGEFLGMLVVSVVLVVLAVFAFRRRDIG